MKDLPETFKRVVQNFEDSVAQRAETRGRVSQKESDQLDRNYVEDKKNLLNVIRELLGYELLP